MKILFMFQDQGGGQTSDVDFFAISKRSVVGADCKITALVCV